MFTGKMLWLWLALIAAVGFALSVVVIYLCTAPR
jgi:hypothetical protein